MEKRGDGKKIGVKRREEMRREEKGREDEMR